MSARRSSAVVGLVVVLGLLLTACQLVDEGADGAVVSQDQTAPPPPVGSPEEEFPSTIGGLRAFLQPEANTWQDEPVLADMTVWLAADGTWERTRVSWVAGGADRMLTVRAAPEVLRIERPLLEGLQLLEVPRDAVSQIPDLPDGLLEPTDLAAQSQAALGACDARGTVRAVLYTTGAPAAWDGQAWSVQPRWRAVVVTARAAVTVDPTDGRPIAPITCVEPLLLDED